jgi:hypothetical protein
MEAQFIIEWKELNGSKHVRKFKKSEEAQSKKMNTTLNIKGSKGLLLSNSIQYTGTDLIEWI